MIIPDEDQRKMVKAMKQRKEQIIRMFETIYNYSYPDKTRCVTIYVDDVDFGFGFTAKPCTDPANPITGESLSSKAGGGVSFESFLDEEDLYIRNIFNDYMSVAEDLLCIWFTRCMKQAKGYENFHLPICVVFEPRFSEYYDLREEEYKTRDEFN